ncbi:hypothetical protein NC651_029226 [Populus alba x Populus x berolinensis]|nr:hypothetical protein NC651_029226 [Populus alba x Populus x berolinensis]
MEKSNIQTRVSAALTDEDIHSILSPTSFNSISRRTRQLTPSRLRPNLSRSNAQPTSIPRSSKDQCTTLLHILILQTWNEFFLV